MIFESLEITKMRGVEIHKREVNGEIQDCVSIPIKINGLCLTSKEKVFMNLLMKERRPNPDNLSHYVSLYTTDKDLIRDIKQSGFEKDYKFLGKAKIWMDYCKRRKASDTDLDKAMSTDAISQY